MSLNSAPQTADVLLKYQTQGRHFVLSSGEDMMTQRKECFGNGLQHAVRDFSRCIWKMVLCWRLE